MEKIKITGTELLGFMMPLNNGIQQNLIIHGGKICAEARTCTIRNKILSFWMQSNVLEVFEI